MATTLSSPLMRCTAMPDPYMVPPTPPVSEEVVAIPPVPKLGSRLPGWGACPRVTVHVPAHKMSATSEMYWRFCA